MLESIEYTVWRRRTATDALTHEWVNRRTEPHPLTQDQQDQFRVICQSVAGVQDSAVHSVSTPLDCDCDPL